MLAATTSHLTRASPPTYKRLKRALAEAPQPPRGGEGETDPHSNTHEHDPKGPKGPEEPEPVSAEDDRECDGLTDIDAERRPTGLFDGSQEACVSSEEKPCEAKVAKGQDWG